MSVMSSRSSIIALTTALALAPMAVSAQLRPIVLPTDDIQHSRYAPLPDIERRFAAFTVSFDSKDDGDGEADLRRVPEWVSQQLVRTDHDCVPTENRPRVWMTDDELYGSGIAPNDASYANSGFDRGHMGAKLLAARVSPDAEWNSHTVLNAVPQNARFNRQIWRNLERLTGAWAQIYGNVWIIQGPVFDRGTEHRWIGDGDERTVAVPDTIFKILVRDKTEDERAASPPARAHEPETMAFLYPQLGPRYYGRTAEFDHERFLTNIREIELLTGLRFFEQCPDCDSSTASLNRIKNQRATSLWPTASPQTPDLTAFVAACRGTRG